MAMAALHDTEVAVTHSEPQATRPAPQLVQVPFTQTWFPLQVTPQPPQWLRSLLRSRQTLPHSVKPEPQSTRQLPATQACPTGQTFPQLPQFSRSTLVSRQLPLQSVVPRPQLVSSQAPFTQTCKAPQALLQPPQ